MDSAMIDSLNTSSHVMITNHPYYPLEVEIASYLANEWSVPTLLGIFAATCATIFLGTYFVVNKVHPHLPRGEKAAIWWFVLCTFSFLLSIFQSNSSFGAPLGAIEGDWN
jgi:cholestenol delta-isomerase